MSDGNPLEEDCQLARNLTKYGQYEEAITIYEGVLEKMGETKLYESHYYLRKLCTKNLKAVVMSLEREMRMAQRDSIFMELRNVHDEARILHINGNIKEAILLYKNALNGLYRLQGSHASGILTCLENLAISMGTLGYRKETIQLQGFVLKGHLFMYGGYHPLTANSLRNLGITISQREGVMRFPLIATLACFRKAYEIWAYTLGPNSSGARSCLSWAYM
jgi:tetratricopeptide (TPR) repeat protein